MRHRFVRTIVALGIIATSATVVALGAPDPGTGTSSIHQHASMGVDASTMSSRSWAGLFALATAIAGAGLVAQRRQRAFDTERRQG